MNDETYEERLARVTANAWLLRVSCGLGRELNRRMREGDKGSPKRSEEIARRADRAIDSLERLVDELEERGMDTTEERLNEMADEYAALLAALTEMWV